MFLNLYKYWPSIAELFINLLFLWILLYFKILNFFSKGLRLAAAPYFCCTASALCTGLKTVTPKPTCRAGRPWSMAAMGGAQERKIYLLWAGKKYNIRLVHAAANISITFPRECVSMVRAPDRSAPCARLLVNVWSFVRERVRCDRSVQLPASTARLTRYKGIDRVVGKWESTKTIASSRVFLIFASHQLLRQPLWSPVRNPSCCPSPPL
jgi:hypothetical protein